MTVFFYSLVSKDSKHPLLSKRSVLSTTPQPNSYLSPPASGPILDLLNVQVQHGGGNASTSRDTTDLANQIINKEEEEEEEHVENLEGQVVDDSIRTNNTTPTPDTLILDSNFNTILVKVLRQLATVTTKLVAASSLAPPKPCPAFRTPEMKRPENFNGSSPAKLYNFLQQCKLIFRNNLDTFSSDLKKLFMPWHSSLVKPLNGFNLI
ncbi:hypothetical protein KEM48_006099 [Puccinia striiformis f. sp. tritici PST-130]|nr:hypothetical protein KEM48_006099 [Puccinia striiformis f. sp. tritici PST-130]